MQRNKTDDLIRDKIERFEADEGTMSVSTNELWERIEPLIYTRKSKKFSWIYYPTAAALLVLFCVFALNRKNDEVIKIADKQTERIEQTTSPEHHVTKAPPQPDVQTEKSTIAIEQPNSTILRFDSEYTHCDDYTYCDGMPDANAPSSFGLYATIITDESNNLFLQ